MYWTDWGQSPKIEKSGMNGQQRTSMIYSKTDLQWPNGLALGKHLYFSDLLNLFLLSLSEYGIYMCSLLKVIGTFCLPTMIIWAHCLYQR